MNKTTSHEIDAGNQITVDAKGLQALTGTGYQTAIQIGKDAGARVQVGRRVLWNVEKVKKYIDRISE